MPWHERLFGAADEQLLQKIASSPDYYPRELVLAKRTPEISFLQGARDTYRKSSFLDHRIRWNPGTKKINCRLADLLAHSDARPAGRVAFIFHVAYCCSTLLARYLELLPGTFVLKEPFILTQLAEMNRAGEVREDLTRLCNQLLARTYDPAEAAIVKLADQCNAVASALMASSGFQRSVFIGLELRSFLLAGLKTDQRRAWVRRRAELAAIDVAPSPLTQIDPGVLDDAQACAYLWLTNGVLLQKLLKNAGSDRIFVIDGEEISENPEGTVREAAAWFGLTLGDSDLGAVLKDEASGHYSKNPAQTFTREDRRSELAAIYSKLSTEVDAALEWASARAPDLGLDPSSGKMLADQRP